MKPKGNKFNALFAEKPKSNTHGFIKASIIQANRPVIVTRCQYEMHFK